VALGRRSGRGYTDTGGLAGAMLPVVPQPTASPPPSPPALRVRSRSSNRCDPNLYTDSPRRGGIAGQACPSGRSSNLGGRQSSANRLDLSSRQSGTSAAGLRMASASVPSASASATSGLPGASSSRFVEITPESLETIAATMQGASAPRPPVCRSGSGLATNWGGLKRQSSSLVMAVRMAKSAEEKTEELLRKKRSKLISIPPRRRMVRFTLGWLANIAILLFIMWMNLTYSVMLGRSTFRIVLVTWFLSLGQTFLVIEPFEVLGITVLPSLFQAECCAETRFKMKEWGFI